MINQGQMVADESILRVLDGIEFTDGHVNVTEDVILANVRSAIRRPYPQIRPHDPNPNRIALVGGGPSLRDTEDELIDLIADGALLVTMNGAYAWCLERNLFPKSHIVMDARPSNARFVQPNLPKCRYILASQCAPETWEAVEGRGDVWMFHAATGTDGPLKTLLDEFYLGQWFGVGGGVTVASRAIMLLRSVGYLRFDLFGVDSCWMGDEHHAFAQPENEADTRYAVTVHPTDQPDLARIFRCSPWHLKQSEDFLQIIRVNGEHFALNIHGDGLLAYMLRACADVSITTEQE